MIIGTAGHIDHGKTSLVRRLTGVETDRLKEEKARGISIALGFALIWHIWWLVVVSLIELIVTAIWHTFDYHRDFDIPAATVAATEDARTRALSSAGQTA